MLYREDLIDDDHSVIMNALVAVNTTHGSHVVPGELMTSIHRSLERKDNKELDYFLEHRISKELNVWIMTMEEKDHPKNFDQAVALVQRYVDGNAVMIDKNKPTIKVIDGFKCLEVGGELHATPYAEEAIKVLQLEDGPSQSQEAPSSATGADDGYQWDDQQWEDYDWDAEGAISVLQEQVAEAINAFQKTHASYGAARGRGGTVSYTHLTLPTKRIV